MVISYCMKAVLLLPFQSERHYIIYSSSFIFLIIRYFICLYHYHHAERYIEFHFSSQVSLYLLGMASLSTFESSFYYASLHSLLSFELPLSACISLRFHAAFDFYSSFKRYFQPKSSISRASVASGSLYCFYSEHATSPLTYGLRSSGHAS